jgi:hypothetical protein
VAIQGVTGRNGAVNGYKAVATHVTLTSTVPALNAAGTELAITRVVANWGATSASAATASPAAIAVGSGLTVAGMQFMDALTAGNFVDGVGVTSQAFSSAGTYTVTATITVS